MLTTLILSALLMLILFAAMMIGVLMGRGPIKGSCGGIGSQGDCPCGRSPGRCGAEADEGTAPERRALSASE